MSTRNRKMSPFLAMRQLFLNRLEETRHCTCLVLEIPTETPYCVAHPTAHRGADAEVHDLSMVMEVMESLESSQVGAAREGFAPMVLPVVHEGE